MKYANIPPINKCAGAITYDIDRRDEIMSQGQPCMSHILYGVKNSTFQFSRCCILFYGIRSDNQITFKDGFVGEYMNTSR